MPGYADVATALTPIGDRLRREVLAADYLQTDDTSVIAFDDRVIWAAVPLVPSRISPRRPAQVVRERAERKRLEAVSSMASLATNVPARMIARNVVPTERRAHWTFP